MGVNSKTGKAEALLNDMGYLWMPISGEWKKTAVYALTEAMHVPGWYRVGQSKDGKRMSSWDGYAIVWAGKIMHFDLSMRPRDYTQPIGYENRVALEAIEINWIKHVT